MPNFFAPLTHPVVTVDPTKSLLIKPAKGQFHNEKINPAGHSFPYLDFYAVFFFKHNRDEHVKV